ncbi:unnamed protein product, partial [Allacma fusca]
MFKKKVWLKRKIK